MDRLIGKFGKQKVASFFQHRRRQRGRETPQGGVVDTGTSFQTAMHRISMFQSAGLAMVVKEDDGSGGG